MQDHPLAREQAGRALERPVSARQQTAHWQQQQQARAPLVLSRPAMSISLSKWPMLPTMALFFILAMSVAMMMSLLPVVVTKMSTWGSTSSMGATV